MNYRKSENWKREGKGFMVMVNHYTEPQREEAACFDSEGPHRWCVYAYVYPSHPHFAAFDGTETMWQGAATMMPGHSYPSFLRIHTKQPDNAVCSYQVGWDYNHHGDWEYTRLANEHEAFGVFADADQLFDWLRQKT